MTEDTTSPVTPVAPASLVLKLADGQECVVPVDPWPSLDLTDEGRLRWQLSLAVISLARAVTGKDEGVADIPNVIGLLQGFEWQQRAIAGAYRALLARSITVGRNPPEDVLEAIDKQAANTEKDVAKLYKRFGDLLYWPDGGKPSS